MTLDGAVLTGLGIVIVWLLWTIRLALHRLSVQLATIAIAVREVQDILETLEDPR